MLYVQSKLTNSLQIQSGQRDYFQHYGLFLVKSQEDPRSFLLFPPGELPADSRHEHVVQDHCFRITDTITSVSALSLLDVLNTERIFLATMHHVERMTLTILLSMAPAAILILAIVIYTGFALPIPYMRGWARWINYLDLVSYGFESLMVNEFWNREFSCSQFIPNYGNGVNQVCSTVGSTAGSGKSIPMLKTRSR